MKAHLILALLTLAGSLACTLASRVSATRSLDQREQAWLEREIDDYRIEVLVVRSVWHAQSHRLTVRNGQVQEATADCIPAPTEAGTCEVEEFDPEEYTVAGLFREAQAQVQSEFAQWVSIAYDPGYGFPQQISYNHPDIIDEDWSWRVTAFEVLK
jgi:hypothetical protein